LFAKTKTKMILLLGTGFGLLIIEWLWGRPQKQKRLLAQLNKFQTVILSRLPAGRQGFITRISTDSGKYI